MSKMALVDRHSTRSLLYISIPIFQCVYRKVILKKVLVNNQYVREKQVVVLLLYLLIVLYYLML